MRIWDHAEEAKRLAERFVGTSQAEFARRHKVPGGASMLSQHIKGRRPINLASATAYAAGFGVPLEEISPRLARDVAATGTLPTAVESQPSDEGPRVQSVHALIDQLSALLLPLDEADREQAEVLLRRIATQPEKSSEWAGKLARLLGESAPTQADLNRQAA